MGHLENVLNKVKEKIGKYTDSKKMDTVEYKLEPKETQDYEQFEKVVNSDGDIEDWYHDVGARGGFKS